MHLPLQRRDSLRHYKGVTKSVMALLLGIAIDQGLIGSVDDKVLSYFPDYTIKRGEKTIQEVTIRHLMTMKAPYKCKDDPWTKVCTSENWTTASLDFLGGRKGLTDEFNYQTVCLHILSGILYRATKMKTVDFADQYLFGPIGIGKHTNHFAKSAEEHKKFTVGKEPKGQIWLADPQGLGTIGYGLCISADDMAKIGQLCLDNGMTNGRQVVSANWIKTITTPTFTTDKRFGNMKYGMLWWIIDCQKPIYAACGNSGNIIYVDEQEKLSIAIASYFKPTVMDRIDFIEKKLLKVPMKL